MVWWLGHLLCKPDSVGALFGCRFFVFLIVYYISLWHFLQSLKVWIPAPVIFTLSFLSQECPFISLDEHVFLFYNKVNIHSIIEEEMNMKFWIDGLDREVIRTMKNRLFLKRSWRFTHFDGGGSFV